MDHLTNSSIFVGDNIYENYTHVVTTYFCNIPIYKNVVNYDIDSNNIKEVRLNEVKPIAGFKNGN